MQVGLDKQCWALVLTSSKYFQSAAVWADGILIPNLHKALFVRHNSKAMITFLKKITTLFLLLNLCTECQVVAQFKESNREELRDSAMLFGSCVSDTLNTVHFVNHPPAFKGDFERFISASIHIDSILSKSNSDTIIDKVIVKFLVSKNGEICRFNFVASNSEYLRKSIVKIFLATPNWQPGTHDGGRFLNVFSQMEIIITAIRDNRKFAVNIYRIKDRIL